MNIPEYSLKNSKVIYFFMAVLLIGGFFSFDSLAKKEDSPFVIKQAMLLVTYPGASPLEMEQLVTEVIEREIQATPDTWKIQSESYHNMAKIFIILKDNTDPEVIPARWDALRRKVLNVQQKLPEGASIIVSDDFGDVFGIYYALTADDGFDYSELRDWSQKIKTDLSSVDGVLQVSLFGEQTAVVNMKISLASLASNGIDPTTIMRIIGSQNQLIASGTKRAGSMDIKFQSDGTYKSLEDIENQIIVTNAGQQIRLKDIVTIEKSYLKPPTTLMRVDGKKAIGIGVSSAMDKDVVKIGDEVQKRLDAISKRLPLGLEVTTLYPENEIAREANNGFIVNLLESIAIVVLILMFVMGFKASVLIGSSLLFSIGGTMLIMDLMGVSLNRTSLAGFIIAMGMLVDNAIVITDNTQVNMARGMKKFDAIIKGATIPQWGLLGATLIATFSFLPLYLAESSVAEIVKPLFIVIGVSLSLSWILALTQTTSFANLMFKETTEGASVDPYDKKLYHKFDKMLRTLIRRRWLTISATIGVFFLSFIVMSQMPQNFFPSLVKPYFRADLIFTAGTSILEVEKDMISIEDYLMDQPEVKRVSITMGATPPRYYLASAAFGPMSNYANMLVELHSQDSTAVVENRVNTYVKENYPRLLIRSSLFKLSPVPEATIEIGYIGNNIDTLVALTDKVKAIMREYPDMVGEVRDNWYNDIPVLKPFYSPAKGQRLGVSRGAIAQSMSIASSGMPIGEYREGDQFMPIMLVDDNIDTFNLSDIESMPVFTSYGTTVPLVSATDSIVVDYDHFVVRRYNRERIMLAMCDPLRGANTMEAFSTIYKRVVEEIEVPEGYKLKFIGEQESQDQSNNSIAAVLPLTFLLIFTTLLLLFREYKKPLVIMLMVPLIFIGVVFGLASMGKMFDFFCMLGMLGLIGMNIKNAIVLIDQVGIEEDEGRGKLDAVIEATKSRVIPVMMASGTTILGMLPLLGDAMFGGMAATIMGGLLIASILTLIVLPVTYCIVFKIQNKQ